MKISLDIAMFLTDLRDKETNTLQRMYAPEVKGCGRARGVSFKSNIKKNDLINLIVHHACLDLSMVHVNTLQYVKMFLSHLEVDQVQFFVFTRV